MLGVKESADAFAYSGRGRVWAAGMPLSAVPRSFPIRVTIARHIASTRANILHIAQTPPEQGMNCDSTHSAEDGGGGYCVRRRVDLR